MKTPSNKKTKRDETKQQQWITKVLIFQSENVLNVETTNIVVISYNNNNNKSSNNKNN